VPDNTSEARIAQEEHRWCEGLVISRNPFSLLSDRRNTIAGEASDICSVVKKGNLPEKTRLEIAAAGSSAFVFGARGWTPFL
jgi:hypothetical protein